MSNYKNAQLEENGSKKPEQRLISLSTTLQIAQTQTTPDQLTPSSTKQRKSAFSLLSLPRIDPVALKEPSAEAKELLRKINEFHITPSSAYWLGKKLLAFKENNVEERPFALYLIESLHNRVAAPLKGYFKDEAGEFNRHAYNIFLEKSLPHIGDAVQETPLTRMANKSTSSSVVSSVVNGLSFDSNDVPRRSAFEDCDGN